MNVDPCTTLTTTTVGVSMGFNEDAGSRQLGTQDFYHLLNNLLSAFLAELADEDAESGLIAVARTTLTVMTE